MKKKKTVVGLIIVGSILLSLGGFVGVVALTGTRNASYVEAEPSYSSWMGTIEDTKKLNDIVIPGAHDAGTSTMPWLGKTQGYTVGQQLKLGCRYFDLRTNNVDGSSEGLVIYHSILNGEKFSSVVSDIKTFISAYPSETLLLDFQHFKNDAAELTYQVLQNELGSYLLSKPSDSSLSDLEYIDSLTLGQTRGKCVLFWGEEYAMAEAKNDLFARNNDECTKSGMSMDSEYISSYHKASSEEFIEKAMPKYFEDIQKKIDQEGHKGMFVLQCQLTDGALIFGPWSREKSHAENMGYYIKNLKNDAKKMSLLNIVMRDFVENENVCKDIIELNQYK